MKLSEFKTALSSVEEVKFQLPNGKFVESHFHVTEVGAIEKRFIDCGGTVRNESVVNFQLWSSIDIYHRLGAEKLNGIIELSEKQLGIGDHEIEVEYQQDTIAKFGLEFNEQGKYFRLLSKQTDCLAKDNCGIPVEKVKKQLSALVSTGDNCCSPESGCC